METTTTIIEEYGNTTKITDVIEEVDAQHSIIVVNGHPIYVRGEWVISDGRELDRRSVVAELKPGMEVTIIFEVAETGKLKALKITVDGLTYTRMEE